MRNLTHAQFHRLWNWMGSPMRRLGNFQRFLDRTGQGDAELRRDLAAAYNALHTLVVSLHYRSCKHGVGRPEKPSDEAASPAADNPPDDPPTT